MYVVTHTILTRVMWDNGMNENTLFKQGNPLSVKYTVILRGPESVALEITWSCEHKDYIRTVDGQGKNTHMQRFEKWDLE